MLERIAEALVGPAQGLKVRQAVLGLGYIAVSIDDGRVGASANITHTASATHTCTVFRQAGTLAGAPVADVLALSGQPGLLPRALALAAINALASGDGYGHQGDIFECLQIKDGENVAMVGFIEPVVAMLAGRGCSLSVFEKRDLNIPYLRPAHAMPATFREADVVILTATSLINGTLEDLLALETPARCTVLMGPSTPMAADFFAGTGITHLAGARIVDGPKALGIVMEGGGTQVLYKRGAMQKVIQEVV